MTGAHPNIALLSKLDLRDLDGSAALFSDDFVWHYFNRNLPELEGSYEGVQGLKQFFKALGQRMKGTFNVEPLAIVPLGNEFICVRVRDTMVFEDKPIALEAVVLWRIVDGKIAEAWDVPAIGTIAQLADGDLASSA